MDNDQRTDRLEERLDRFAEQTRLEMQAIDVRLTRIETQMATKTDLQEALNSVVKWVVGTMLGAGVAAVTIMTFVLNNATPRAAPASPAPVIIQLPPATTAPAARQ